MHCNARGEKRLAALFSLANCERLPITRSLTLTSRRARHRRIKYFASCWILITRASCCKIALVSACERSSRIVLFAGWFGVRIQRARDLDCSHKRWSCLSIGEFMSAPLDHSALQLSLQKDEKALISARNSVVSIQPTGQIPRPGLNLRMATANANRSRRRSISGASLIGDQTQTQTQTQPRSAWS